jgi:Ca2+-binding EF-hand superfamily protein
VDSFIQIFLKVDENFSGELNLNEWIRLFSTMHRNVTEIEARKMFYKIDKNSDGLIQLQELIPIVFPKADKLQLKLILKEANSYLSDVEFKVPLLRSDEVDELFNCYDFNKTNYVLVGFIRERVR